MNDVILQPNSNTSLSFKCIVQVAHVAELVDAADSKSAIRKGVKVRFLSWAPLIKNPCNVVAGIFITTSFCSFLIIYLVFQLCKANYKKYSKSHLGNKGLGLCSIKIQRHYMSFESSIKKKYQKVSYRLIFQLTRDEK